jgi:hypothetical protein
LKNLSFRLRIDRDVGENGIWILKRTDRRNVTPQLREEKKTAGPSRRRAAKLNDFLDPIRMGVPAI